MSSTSGVVSLAAVFLGVTQRQKTAVKRRPPAGWGESYFPYIPNCVLTTNKTVDQSGSTNVTCNPKKETPDLLT